MWVCDASIQYSERQGMIVVPTEKRLDWQSPPIALLAILLLNILVFIFYQTGDGARVNQAVDHYVDSKLIDIEWPAYREFYQDENDEELPESYKDVDEWVYQQLIFDEKFFTFLEKKRRRYVPVGKIDEWQKNRETLESLVQSVSSMAYGLKPSDNKIVTYFTHQFLHGGVMHLVGNMVFLLLFGFAVEAALGSARFLLYYIIGGLGAGGLFALYTSLSGGNLTIPLVGASGSISAVMAMYVSLYRLKRIEFFYWVFVLVGYFRAPAILLLPVYIAYEILQLNLVEGSNVAYMAHVGGFITGAILVMLTQVFVQEGIDEQYLADEVEVDPYLKGLDRVYKDIAAFRFKSAYQHNEALSKQYGNRPEIEELRLNLLKGLSKSSFKKFLLLRLKRKKNLPKVVESQLMLWAKLTAEEKQTLTIDQKVNLAVSALNFDQDPIARSIYKDLVMDESNAENNAPKLSELACGLGVFYKNLGQHERSEKYMKHGRQLMEVG